MDQTNTICQLEGSFQISNNSSQSNSINTTYESTSCTSSSSGRNKIIDQNKEYMDQAGCTNTGIVSNEISNINVCTELCVFQNPNSMGDSDKIFKPYIGVNSNTHDNDESKILNTDNCYQHVQSGESNSTTHFLQIKSEPNICVNSSNHATGTCTETEIIGSPRSIQNTEVSIKMETITHDVFDPSGGMLTDDLTHKSGKNSLHVHEQLDRLSSNSTNYAICIKYEPDSGAEGESYTPGSISCPSRSEDLKNNHHIRDNSHCYGNCSNIPNNALNRGDQPSCGPIKIEINDSHMQKDSKASISPQHNCVNTFYHDNSCCASYEQSHSSHKSENIQMGKQPGDLEKLLSPKQDYTKKEFKCDVCSYTTICMSYLKRHKMQHAVEKPYKCDVCSYSTVRTRDLVRHKRKHTEEKPYMCEVCGFTTRSANSLRSHKRTHTAEKLYKCDVCSYNTVWPNALAVHKRKHTEEKPYKCYVCSYSTISSSILERHKTKHTGEKPYKCDMCSYSTSRSDHLVEHKVRHTGEKPYKCDVCNYSSVRSRDLVTHKRKHTREKPYKCNVCSYSTVRPEHLTTHKRKHTGEKPYKCNVCSYSTVGPADLTTHKRKHTGEKPYMCDVCNFSTAWPRSLKAHKQQHMDK